MITIFEKKYDKYDTNILWGKYEGHFHSRKVRGISPFISFHIDGVGYLGLETIYSKENFGELKIDKKIDITEYISDITIEEDKNGWYSIITNKGHSCYITRLNEHEYKLEFCINYNDYFDEKEKRIVIDSNLII